MRLDHEEPPAFIDGERHRILQQRLAGNEFNLQPGRELELFHVQLGWLVRGMRLGGGSISRCRYGNEHRRQNSYPPLHGPKRWWLDAQRQS